MTDLHRAQILLSRRQHSALERLAREEQRSISALVREVVDEYLARRGAGEALDRAVVALNKLAELRTDIEARGGLVGETFLDDLRAERDAELGQIET